MRKKEPTGYRTGLDRPRPGKPRTVPAQIETQIYDRVCAGADLERDGVVAFRANDVKKWLEEDYGINLGKTAVYNLLHRSKLR